LEKSGVTKISAEDIRRIAQHLSAQEREMERIRGVHVRTDDLLSAHNTIVERLKRELEHWKDSGPDCGCENIDPSDTGWGCYCCGDVFCDGCASEHFGMSEGQPACAEKLEVKEREIAALKKLCIETAEEIEQLKADTESLRRDNSTARNIAASLTDELEAKEREIQRYRTTILKYGHAQYTHDRGMWCFWSDRHEDACTSETCIWLEIEALEVPIDSRISRSNQYY
jgi:hypothetical protein